jgi:hypothetical protein
MPSPPCVEGLANQGLKKLVRDDSQLGLNRLLKPAPTSSLLERERYYDLFESLWVEFPAACCEKIDIYLQLKYPAPWGGDGLLIPLSGAKNQMKSVSGKSLYHTELPSCDLSDEIER